MLAAIDELFRKRELLFMITWRDVRVKYKQSVMGLAWAVFMPLVIVLAGILVKFAFARLSGDDLTFEDIATVSVKATPWAFFVTAIRFGTNSLIGNINLVTKVYMPREIFPFAAVLSQFVDFLVASVVLAIVLAVAGVGASIYLLWIPLLVLILLILTAGLSVIASAASLFFRDVKYIVDVVLTFAVFFTPVFYEVEMFGELGYLLLLNPIAPVLESLSHCVVDQRLPDTGWLAYSAGSSLAVLAFAFWSFKKWEPRFAESI